MSFRNPEEIKDAFDGESQARILMLPYYPIVYGLQVVNTNGTRARDIECVSASSGKRYAVEEKFIQGDFNEFCIEILQDMISRNPGWFYTTKADILMYVACEPKTWRPIRAFAIHWADFKKWWVGYLSEHHIPKAIISPKGYGLSLNLAIRWPQIPKTLYIERRLKAAIVPDAELC